jgi:hypothetical protein
MKYKLNIIDPWESGTESAIDAYLVKEKSNEFLLFVKNNIKVRGENAHYFICELKNEEDKTAFKNCVKKVYPINMVFDKNIINEQQDIPDINSYRANFLSGEIIILD